MQLKAVILFAAMAAVANCAQQVESSLPNIAFLDMDAAPVAHITRRDEDEEGSCEKDSQCKKFGPNVGCNNDVCTCNPGFYVGEKGRCVKVTKKVCTKFCKDKIGSDSECLDVKRGTCRCTSKGEVVNASGTKCVKYTRDQCDKDCRAQYGKNFECAPKTLAACAKK